MCVRNSRRTIVNRVVIQKTCGNYEKNIIFIYLLLESKQKQKTLCVHPTRSNDDD